MNPSTLRPLLETKLFAPRLKGGAVPRPRLDERLRRGAASRLTLVSAPAGFGKTTLLAQLAAAPPGDRSVAWVSLDAGDNDPGVFWAYVIASLDRAAPPVGTRARSVVEATGAPEAALSTLLNDLASLPIEVVLVLDDYHVVESGEIAASMAYLIEHTPPNFHVVIGTRADPGLPLSRLRATGDLVEIRAADLRFSPNEAASFLNGTMGLGLSDANVDALEDRTEGWIAALQLAALSMEGRPDVNRFIADFAGNDRYVVDYLVEEVLRRQPDTTRRFLLRTSILARMTGPLCDAVAGGAFGGVTLEALERGNLFLVPLDNQRRWYRYHHLFADVLHARLLEEQADEVSGLHRRASDWYEADGDRAEATRHALAGKDFERAADLIELEVPSMQRARQETSLRAWCDALPRELFRVRPVLAVAYVGALMSTGYPEGAGPLLEDAERALADPTGVVVVDEAAFRRLPGAVARYRAALALVAGDLGSTVAHAHEALSAADEEDHLGQGAAAALLGLAEWSRGDLDAAYRFYADGMATLERGGFVPDAVGGAITLADIRITQGRLSEAMRIYERGMTLAAGTEGVVLRGAADMHVGIAEVLYERNDLEGAKTHLHASRALGETNGFPKHPWRSRVAAARLRWAEGDDDEAIELLDEAERRYVADYAPDVRPVAALRARLWITQGRLHEAWAWATERSLSATDETDYLREFEHIVFGRLLLAQGERDVDTELVREAAALCERLVVAADDGGRAGRAIEILVVQALARYRADDAEGAVASLNGAVERAEPEGYVRVFLDEGAPMATLLKLALRAPNASGYVGHLLTGFAPGLGRPAVPQPLVEALSERELEVLRLLQSDLGGPDIARELSVSLNTLRTHTKNIYGKLGVTSRRAAVRRAVELEVLARA